MELDSMLDVRFEYIAVIFAPQTENPAPRPGLCMLIALSSRSSNLTKHAVSGPTRNTTNITGQSYQIQDL